VLVPRWSGTGEAAWFIHQVVAALLGRYDVHVITLEGPSPGWPAPAELGRRGDRAGPTVHGLAALPAPRWAARREVLLAALSAVQASSVRPTGPTLDRMVEEGDVEVWASADGLLAGLDPDVVVVAGYRHLGAFALWRRACPGVPLALLPLADTRPTVGLACFDPSFDRADAVLVSTAGECDAVRGPARTVGRNLERVHRLGLPGPGDDLPVVGAGTRTGVVVFTGCPADAHDRPAVLARLVALALPHLRVMVVATDTLVTWSAGRQSRAPAPADRRQEVSLVVGAAAMVDLQPGPLLARRCVDALRCGTAAVAPEGTRGAELVREASGGLWFSAPGDLVPCIQALMDPEVHGRLGAQGRQYAEAEFGSTAAFDDRVVAAVGAAQRRGGAGRLPDEGRQGAGACSGARTSR
jgi:hypothetical protein